MKCDSCNKEFDKLDNGNEDGGESVASEFGFIDLDAICQNCENLMLDILNGQCLVRCMSTPMSYVSAQGYQRYLFRDTRTRLIVQHSLKHIRQSYYIFGIMNVWFLAVF